MAVAYRRSIDEFWSGTPPTDWTSVIKTALATGDAIGFPARDYNIVLPAGDAAAIKITTTKPIDVECAMGARFVVDGASFNNKKGSVFELIGSPAPATYGVDLVTFRWSGGEIDGSAVSAAGTQGVTLLDISQFYMPTISNVRFNGGTTNPKTDGPSGITTGCIDVGLAAHGCVGGRYSNNDFIGFFDQGIYLSGTRKVETVHAVLSVSNTPNLMTIRADWPGHGLRVGDYVSFGPAVLGGNPIYIDPGRANTSIIRVNQPSHSFLTGDVVTISGAEPVNGVNVNGDYSITLVDVDNYNVTCTSAVPDTPSPGPFGGAAVAIMPKLMDGLSISGRYPVQSITNVNRFTFTVTTPATGPRAPFGTFQLASSRSDMIGFGLPGQEEISGNRFYRCGGMIASKRNERLLSIIGNYGTECGGGVLGGLVDEPASQGKRFIIDRNVFYKIQGRPIFIVGSRNDIVTNNQIINFGRLLTDGTSPTNAAFDNVISGIDMRSCQYSIVTGNILEQEDDWAGAPSHSDKGIRGITLRADDEYKVGTSYAKVKDNIIIGVNYALEERESLENHNNFQSNAVLPPAASYPSKFLGSLPLGLDTRDLLSPDQTQPILKSGSTQVAATVVHRYRINEGWLQFQLEITVTTAPGAGALTIANLARPNSIAGDDAVIPLVTRDLASTAPGDIVGYVKPTTSVLDLYSRGGGTLTALSGSALVAGSKIFATGAYFVG